MAKTTQMFSRKARQSGAAVLLIAVLILLAVTIAVVFSAQTAFMEQRMSANEYRAKQAASAAQAGLEIALSEITTRSPDADFSQAADAPDLDIIFRARYWTPGPGTPPPACPDDPADMDMDTNHPPDTRRALVYSCGWSDDLSARSVAIVEVRAGPSLGAPPNTPLTSRGAVDTNGQARVFNLFSNLTIWSGGSLDITGNPGNTFIRNPNYPRPSASDPLPDEPANCGVHTEYICTTDANATGPDVIQGDLSLSSLSEDDFFRNFMGLIKSEYRDTVVTVEDPDDLSDVGGQVVWINGDSSLEGQIGSRNNPVVLVVDGDVTVSGSLEFYGVFYMTGDLFTTGRPRYYGSAIIEGEIDKAGGNPYFIFDPLAIEIASGLGRRTGLYGTWRNWTI